MKAGIVSNGLVYAMGVDPGGTSGVTIIGVHERTIYRDYPGKISYLESFEVNGTYTEQALEIADAAREFFPLALIVESFYPGKPITSEEYLSPLRVGERIAFCAETHYIICPFFWQTPSQAMKTAPDARLKLWGLYQSGPDHTKDSTRHAITFIRRATSDTKLRDSAWGPAERRSKPVKRGSARSVRRLYLTDGYPERNRQDRKMAGGKEISKKWSNDTWTVILSDDGTFLEIYLDGEASSVRLQNPGTAETGGPDYTLSAESGRIPERHYFITIRPTNVSGVGDPACRLQVSMKTTIIDEPIEAEHANDGPALRRAVADVAERLSIPSEWIGY